MLVRVDPGLCVRGKAAGVWEDMSAGTSEKKEDDEEDLWDGTGRRQGVLEIGSSLLIIKPFTLPRFVRLTDESYATNQCHNPIPRVTSTHPSTPHLFPCFPPLPAPAPSSPSPS